MKHLLLVLPVLFVACGAPSGPAGPSTPADQPKAGGRLNVWINPDPWEWDLSYNGKSEPNGSGQGMAFNSLLGFKSGVESNGFADLILRPELADRWEVSTDAKNFTFHLRKGVRFADLPPVNGRELTAADVKFSYEYQSRTGEFKKLGSSSFDWMFEGLDKVETPDPYTVRVAFTKPFVPFISYAASDWNPIVAKEVYEADGHLKDRPVGSGPFILDIPASQKGTRWMWKKNPAYFEAGMSYLDEVRWLVIGSEAAAYAAFQTKQVDLLESREGRDTQDILRNSPQAEMQEYLQPRGYHLYLGQRGPLANKQLRQALASAVDRDEMMRLFTGGKGGWTPPGALHGLFTDTEARQLMKYDPDQAKRLVAQAGYPNGVTLEWIVSAEEAESTTQLSQLVQAQLKKAGMNVEFKTFDKTTQRLKRRAGEFDLDSSSGLGQLEADTDSMLWSMYHSAASGNYAKIKDPELDKLLEAQRQEINAEKRRDVLRTLVRYLNDQAWAVDLFYPPQWDLWHPYVKNYRPHFGNRGGYWMAWLDK